jgi:hypothetical protein
MRRAARRQALWVVVRLVIDVWFLDAGLDVPRQTLSMGESESAVKSSLPHTSLLKSTNALCRSACIGRLGSFTGSKGVAGGLFCNQRGTCILLAYALQSLVVVEFSRNPLICDPNPELGLAIGGRFGLNYALITKWEHLLGKFSDGSFVCGEGWASNILTHS